MTREHERRAGRTSKQDLFGMGIETPRVPLQINAAVTTRNHTRRPIVLGERGQRDDCRRHSRRAIVQLRYIIGMEQLATKGGLRAPIRSLDPLGLLTQNLRHHIDYGWSFDNLCDERTSIIELVQVPRASSRLVSVAPVGLRECQQFIALGQYRCNLVSHKEVI